MSEIKDPSSSSNGLRAEIAEIAFGDSSDKIGADAYLRRTPVETIIEDLRRAVEAGAAVSSTLGLMLRLDDTALGLTIATLRDGGQLIGERADERPLDVGENIPPEVAGALAESYMVNHQLTTILDAAATHLARLLTRMERNGTNLETDATTRPALQVIGTYAVWRDDPDSPQVAELIEELTAARQGRSIFYDELSPLLLRNLLTEGERGGGKTAFTAALTRARESDS